MKQIISDTGNISAYRSIGQIEAHGECRVADACNAIGDCHASQAAPLEGTIPNAGDIGAERDAGKVGAHLKRRDPDVGNTVRDYDTGQALEASERPVPDAGDR